MTALVIVQGKLLSIYVQLSGFVKHLDKRCLFTVECSNTSTYITFVTETLPLNYKIMAVYT